MVHLFFTPHCTISDRLLVGRTCSPSIHWIVPILAGVPFGVGVAQIQQSSTAYLMDAYGIYFASAISATIVLRSICGAVFPLFSPAMFNKLGDAWAMTVFASLSLVCMPIPFLFWVSSILMFWLAYRHPNLFRSEIREVDTKQIEVRVQGGRRRLGRNSTFE